MGHTVETKCGRPRRGVSQLGKNSVPGNRKPDQRTLSPVARAAAAAGVLAASLYAVNLSAGPAGPVQLAGWVAGTGAQSAAVPSGTSGSDNVQEAHSEPVPPASDQVGAAGAFPPAILSNPLVTLTFPHTAIGGAAQPARGDLTVGPAGMGRPGAGFLMAPLQLLNPSSPFGFRFSPITGTAGDFHLGQDYAAACGTPVHAADAGVVRAAGWHPWGGGNRVEIDHGDGLITTYNHLESIGVRSGDTVQAGQVIARVGSTGWSTGCHLHFEAILNGRYANPLRWSFLQLRDVTWTLPAGMVSYTPGQGMGGGRITWTIPLKVDTGDGFPAAGLQAPPFPPLLPLAPAPAPAEATGVVLPHPDVQLTTAATPPAEPSPTPAPNDPAPSPINLASSPDPSPTPTPSPTTSPSPTHSSPTPTPPPSTPGPSPTPSPTHQRPTPTPTPTGTATPTPTPTPSPTGASRPPTPSPTPTPTPSPRDPSPSPTPSPTPTPTPSPTGPSPTPTPTPTRTQSEPAPASREPVSSPGEPLPSAPVTTVPAPAPPTVAPAHAPTLPPAEPAPAPVPAPPTGEPAASPTLPPAEPEPTPTPTLSATSPPPPA